MTLLVGPDDPPKPLPGEMTPVTNSSVAGLVQAGERRTVATKNEPGRGGVLCWATLFDR